MTKSGASSSSGTSRAFNAAAYRWTTFTFSCDMSYPASLAAPGALVCQGSGSSLATGAFLLAKLLIWRYADVVGGSRVRCLSWAA
jgi:hypothetical protein